MSGGSLTIEDLRRAAMRRLPRAVFNTIDGAAGEEAAAHRNLDDLRAMTLLPRVLHDVTSVDTSVAVLGRSIDFPVILAPVGYAGLYYPQAERHVAVAAAAAGTLHALSTYSSVSLEDVAGAAGGRRWFQLYPFQSRDLNRHLMGRARRAGYEALCVTVDVPVVGTRNRDMRGGLRASGVTPRFLLAAVLHPGWSLPFAFGYRPRFMSLEPYLPRASRNWLPLRSPNLNPSFEWRDLEWTIAEWNGPVVVKGILHADDAERAFAIGAAAIVVSNHGGRQFESAPSTISVLPAIRARLGEGREIYTDGGVRTGADVLKFLVAGANAVLCGRAYVYGLCVAGEAGVRRALEILRRELEMAMRLSGVVRLGRTELNRLLPAAAAKEVRGVPR
ncbi:MAG TPA: alpha-hydroxy acid oxidase [Candidatus Polarisedimenticolia bacterium]|jgi:isopentenyl diphosphate isomerase/L-lactate dehydrogenase-like FMN-dependent dehydrogenase|nr:alpha-hydroxy acid oxidase [Candidatus Polarisedimenticolia bacterium]